jgi:YesN/AraC family two-component response regulator
MAEPDWSAVKILIIDDDALLRRGLSNVVRRLGCGVLEAVNGIEGMRHFQQHKPDVIITDILMPEKEGLETIREMRKENPAVRIIAISAGSPVYKMQFLELAEKFGASYTFNKPINPDELLGAIRTLLV